MLTDTRAKGSVSQQPISAELPSPLSYICPHCNQSTCPPQITSSNNLSHCSTLSTNFDVQTIKALSDISNLQSPQGSYINLIPRHPNGNESPQFFDSGVTTPVCNGENNIGTLGQKIHENIHAEPPYHVFSHKKKKKIMYLAATAGMFSSLSANIYFPALGQISRVCPNLY